MFSKRNYSISVEYLEDIYFSSEQVRNVFPMYCQHMGMQGAGSPRSSGSQSCSHQLQGTLKPTNSASAHRGGRNWERISSGKQPFLPAKLPNAFEMTSGRIKRKILQEQVLRACHCLWREPGRSQQDRGQASPPIGVCLWEECLQKSGVMYIHLQINELHTIIFHSTPLGRQVLGSVVYPVWTPLNGCKA